MKRVTIKRLLSWGPCGEYKDKEYLLKLTGGRRSLTPLQIADLDIPAEDKLWVLLRPEIISEKRLHLLACDFAEDVLPIFEQQYPGDKRPRQAIEAKRLWLNGEITDDELAVAREAARAAAGEADWGAWAAARAARAVAREAARAAAWEAARTARAAAGAAWEEAWEEARAAAGEAAHQKQLNHVMRVL